MVVLGRIIAPFGLQGWLKVFPMGDDPEAWRSMPSWWLGRDPEGSEWQSFEIEALRPHGKWLAVKLKGVDDRTAAEGLDGRYIGAPREALPPTAADEYYWADLIGLSVVNEQDVVLGVVAELLESGANDLLVVRAGAGPEATERLLPFVAQVVKKVDVAAGVIRVDWLQDW